MSENQHTPGPWKVKGATIWGKNGPLAVVQGPSQPTMDGAHIEPEANRRLIAAAPTMLEALEKILKIKRTVDMNLFDVEEIHSLAKAAIRAAKGEAFEEAKKK